MSTTDGGGNSKRPPRRMINWSSWTASICAAWSRHFGASMPLPKHNRSRYSHKQRCDMEIHIEDRCMRDLGSGREDAEHDDALYAEIRAEMLAPGITEDPGGCTTCQGTGHRGH